MSVLDIALLIIFGPLIISLIFSLVLGPMVMVAWMAGKRKEKAPTRQPWDGRP